MGAGWRKKALDEIASIKPVWNERYRWNPMVRLPKEAPEVEAAQVDLYLSFRGKRTGTRQYLLRLRYASDFETAGRREAFVNPENVEEEGPQFWPSIGSPFNPTHSPPAVCLEGAWGFHSVLHRERDGRRANLNKLLMEIQRCLDRQ